MDKLNIGTKAQMFKKKKSYLKETTIAIIESVNDLMIAVRSWLACAVYRTLLTVVSLKWPLICNS